MGSPAPPLAESAILPQALPHYETHDRHLLVALQNPYSFAQIARLLHHDDMEGSLAWSQIAGTVTKAAGRSLTGLNALSCVTGAVAGNQAIARKVFPLAADQASSTDQKLIVSCWFSPSDANWRDIQVVVRPDDGVNKRWEAGFRYLKRNVGVLQHNPQYEDAGQIFQNLTTYAVRDGTAANGDPWHFVMVVLNYLQGNPGRLTYHLLKFDDMTSGVGGVNPVVGVSSASLATNTFRELSVDLVVTTDVAGAATVLFDEVVVSDIAAVKNLL